MHFMKTNSLLTVALIFIISAGSALARENVGTKSSKQRKSVKAVLAEGCAPATSSADLNINNVRTRILGSGDMWWDLNDAKYEVPKGSDKHSMFAGALWLGGIDEANNLKLAAMTYRQTGVDYWPGPLDDNASITAEQCQSYNRHWIVYRDEVETHKAWIDCKANPDCNEGERFPGYAENIPESIKDWPGNGIRGQELPTKLAPYFESDSLGIPGFYDVEFDYPAYDLFGNQDCRTKEVDILYGDQTIWWVYNDKGNIHTETQAGALGFEIRAQAFAFTSNDEVNNMTFNNYRIINKSTFRLTDTYFGTWFDPDLGNARDDIIGSDIARGLGYCYNADSDDEGPNGYGQNPPAIGFDFFQGPFADYFDGVDNDRDGCPPDHVRNDKGECIPEDPNTGINERIIMSGFMYYNNVTGVQGNPDVALDYYNYLRSLWKNGNSLIIETPSGKGNSANGDGYVASNQGVATVFAYPGLSFDTTGAYPPNAPVDWWESPANLNDKRGLHSAGPFSLAPGALNFITTGNVWARNFASNDLFASVNDVIIADDKAQQLFDNCFKILDGPSSPSLDGDGGDIVELDRELIFKLGGNLFDENNPDNAIITYNQKDPAIPAKPGWTATQIDSATTAGYFNYRFEGFQIFQVANADVSVDNLYDPAQSRLIFQSDLKNDIEQLINYETDASLQNGALVPVDKTLEANNNGIQLTYRLLEDAFATGDKRLINNREYYFYIVAYSQNQYEITDPLNLSQPSQKEPYLAGRDLGNGQKPYLAIPHKRERDGKIYNSEYGQGLPITRFSGAGTSGNFVKLTNESREGIAKAQGFEQDVLEYLPGFGPFDVKVVDPTKVVAGDFKLTFSKTDPVDSATWTVTSVSDPSFAPYTSKANIGFLGEEIIDELGISIAFRNAERPGDDSLELRNNGVVGGEQVFRNSKRQWLTGVEDDDSYAPTNWILAGNASDGSAPGSSYNDKPGDPAGEFENILNGTWAPVSLGSTVPRSTGVNGTAGFGIKPNGTNIPLSRLSNIDVVITSDPSMWSRCPVIELGDEATANDGGTRKFTLRSGRTLNLVNGELVPDADPNNTGWSYFPGYAVNVETGRRLSIAFGESSWLKSENGGDMKWNPSSRIRDKLGNFVMGGMHVIYILGDSINTTGGSNFTDLTYSGDNITDWPLYSVFSQVPTVAITQLFRSFAWASLPLVSDEQFEFGNYEDIPSDVTVSLRVAKPYQQTDRNESNEGYPEYGFSTMGSEAVPSIDVAKSALDDIRVVPNPYYGSSLYEDSQLDNIVKITNLPDNCKINIFMTNGTLVRSFNKANTLSYLEWDLKNDFNVPIASGVYIIHIDAGELGEKVVKWIGSIRPVDLNAF
jgi:hypothetical protein